MHPGLGWLMSFPGLFQPLAGHPCSSLSRGCPFFSAVSAAGASAAPSSTAARALWSPTSPRGRCRCLSPLPFKFSEPGPGPQPQRRAAARPVPMGFLRGASQVGTMPSLSQPSPATEQLPCPTFTQRNAGAAVWRECPDRVVGNPSAGRAPAAARGCRRVWEKLPGVGAGGSRPASLSNPALPSAPSPDPQGAPKPTPCHSL